MFSYQQHTNGIYELLFIGTFSVLEIISNIENFRISEDLPENILMLYDLSEAKLNFRPEEVEQLVKYTETSTQQFKRVRTAILVNDPDYTAYCILFSNNEPHTYIMREVFSTKKGAINWLLSHKA